MMPTSRGGGLSPSPNPPTKGATLYSQRTSPEPAEPSPIAGQPRRGPAVGTCRSDLLWIVLAVSARVAH
eukprot:4812864-Prymnesium_polylepis.1